jgi:2-desacetyl-2-hydroxyethyl bacteriochlorophyllide A dehydrogenase
VKQSKLYGPKDVRIEEVPMPEPGAHDALVRVETCGICGTDTAAYLAGDVAGGGVYSPPTQWGHEIVGRVAGFGADVHDLNEGLRVAVNPMLARSAGYMESVKAGGFGQYMKVENAELGTNLFAVPESISDLDAATVEPAVTGFHLARAGEPKPGEKVVIFGAGAMGLTALIALTSLGIDDVVVADLSESRLEKAKQMGARTVVNPQFTDTAELLKEHHGEFNHVLGGADTDIYIDTAGARQVIETALGSAKFNSRIIFFGTHKEPVAIHPLTIISKELTLKGSMGYRPDEWGPTIDLIEAGKLRPGELVTHRIGFSDIGTALETSTRAEEAIKVIVEL